MKKSAKFLNFLLAFLLLFQGVRLVAACSVPCHMADADKVRCVLASILEHDLVLAHEHAGALRSQGVCGRLEVRDQAAAVDVVKVKLIRYAFERFVAFVPLMAFVSGASFEGIHAVRAGPIGPSTRQPLLAVPPQNAPPVLV